MNQCTLVHDAPVALLWQLNQLPFVPISLICRFVPRPFRSSRGLAALVAALAFFIVHSAAAQFVHPGGLHTQADFAVEVARLSEEPATKKQQGDLGWVTRGAARVPGQLREALFRLLETGGTIPEGGRLIGPVRLDSGVALLWASERRPSPSWEEMSERVHEELRRRFLEELMPKESVELVDPRE